MVRVAGLGRVHAELARRQVEDRPAVAGVDRAPAEDVAEDGAERLRLGRVEQDVRARDRHQASGSRPRILRALAFARSWTRRRRSSRSCGSARVRAPPRLRDNLLDLVDRRLRGLELLALVDRRARLGELAPELLRARVGTVLLGRRELPGRGPQRAVGGRDADPDPAGEPREPSLHGGRCYTAARFLPRLAPFSPSDACRRGRLRPKEGRFGE